MECSPKNMKRDRKPATERQIPAAQDSDGCLYPSDNEKGRKRRLQDPLPLEETPRGVDGRTSAVAMEKDANNSLANATPTHGTRPSHYFQHDDRGVTSSARSNKRRTSDDRWTEPRAKPHYHDRAREDSPKYSSHRKNPQQELSQIKPNDTWTHDKFLESQVEETDRKARQSPPKKREFRERPYLKSENSDDKKGDGLDKRSERKYPDMNLARRERERFRERGEELESGRWMEFDHQGRFQPRRGYGRNMGDRERPGGRVDSGRRSSGATTVAERWTHDRFQELNRSPTPKHEEDSIAQIEALLAA